MDATPDVDCMARLFDGGCAGDAGFCHGGPPGPALVRAASGAVEAGGVHLLDVPMDYTENTRVLIEELAQKACLL